MTRAPPYAAAAEVPVPSATAVLRAYGIEALVLDDVPRARDGKKKWSRAVDETDRVLVARVMAALGEGSRLPELLDALESAYPDALGSIVVHNGFEELRPTVRRTAGGQPTQGCPVFQNYVSLVLAHTKVFSLLEEQVTAASRPMATRSCAARLQRMISKATFGCLRRLGREGTVADTVRVTAGQLAALRTLRQLVLHLDVEGLVTWLGRRYEAEKSSRESPRVSDPSLYRAAEAVGRRGHNRPSVAMSAVRAIALPNDPPKISRPPPAADSDTIRHLCDKLYPAGQRTVVPAPDPSPGDPTPLDAPLIYNRLPNFLEEHWPERHCSRGCGEDLIPMRHGRCLLDLVRRMPNGKASGTSILYTAITAKAWAAWYAATTESVCPEAVHAELMGRLSLAEKENGDFRPIGITGAPSRCRSAFQHHYEVTLPAARARFGVPEQPGNEAPARLARTISPHQYGVGVKDATAIVYFRLLCSAPTLRPLRTGACPATRVSRLLQVSGLSDGALAPALLCTDATAAFQFVDASAALRRIARHMPNLSPALSLKYASDFKPRVVYQDGKLHTRIIEQHRGVVQGCPWGPFVFSAGWASVLDGTYRALYRLLIALGFAPEAAFLVLGYLDDAFVSVPAFLVRVAFQLLAHFASGVGVTLNAQKSAFLIRAGGQGDQPGSSAPYPDLAGLLHVARTLDPNARLHPELISLARDLTGPAQAVPRAPDGVVILGFPLGNERFVREFLERKEAMVRKDYLRLALVARVPRPRVALNTSLVANSCVTTQVTHINRVFAEVRSPGRWTTDLFLAFAQRVQWYQDAVAYSIAGYVHPALAAATGLAVLCPFSTEDPILTPAETPASRLTRHAGLLPVLRRNRSLYLTAALNALNHMARVASPAAGLPALQDTEVFATAEHVLADTISEILRDYEPHAAAARKAIALQPRDSVKLALARAGRSAPMLLVSATMLAGTSPPTPHIALAASQDDPHGPTVALPLALRVLRTDPTTHELTAVSPTLPPSLPAPISRSELTRAGACALDAPLVTGVGIDLICEDARSSPLTIETASKRISAYLDGLDELYTAIVSARDHPSVLVDHGRSASTPSMALTAVYRALPPSVKPSTKLLGTMKDSEVRAFIRHTAGLPSPGLLDVSRSVLARPTDTTERSAKCPVCGVIFRSTDCPSLIICHPYTCELMQEKRTALHHQVVHCIRDSLSVHLHAVDVEIRHEHPLVGAHPNVRALMDIVLRFATRHSLLLDFTHAFPSSTFHGARRTWLEGSEARLVSKHNRKMQHYAGAVPQGDDPSVAVHLVPLPMDFTLTVRDETLKLLTDAVFACLPPDDREEEVRRSQAVAVSRQLLVAAQRQALLSTASLLAHYEGLASGLVPRTAEERAFLLDGTERMLSPDDPDGAYDDLRVILARAPGALPPFESPGDRPPPPPPPGGSRDTAPPAPLGAGSRVPERAPPRSPLDDLVVPRRSPDTPSGSDRNRSAPRRPDGAVVTTRRSARRDQPAHRAASAARRPPTTGHSASRHLYSLVPCKGPMRGTSPTQFRYSSADRRRVTKVPPHHDRQPAPDLAPAPTAHCPAAAPHLLFPSFPPPPPPPCASPRGSMSLPQTTPPLRYLPLSDPAAPDQPPVPSPDHTPRGLRVPPDSPAAAASCAPRRTHELPQRGRGS